MIPDCGSRRPWYPTRSITRCSVPLIRSHNFLLKGQMIDHRAFMIAGNLFSLCALISIVLHLLVIPLDSQRSRKTRSDWIGIRLVPIGSLTVGNLSSEFSNAVQLLEWFSSSDAVFFKFVCRNRDSGRDTEIFAWGRSSMFLNWVQWIHSPHLLWLTRFIVVPQLRLPMALASFGHNLARSVGNSQT